MIPMRKTSHTWILLAILFSLDYSGVKMEAEPPLPAGWKELSSENYIESELENDNCEETLVYKPIH
jgi:hypothetical protein